ncbi:MAG: FMN-binding glutamate synthase family protein [Mariprofundaceae bacterium]
MLDHQFTVTDIIVVMGWSAGIVMLILFLMFLQDILQPHSSIRRNFPVLGRMRYFLEKQGEFFRQYFFAHDRQEMPFNRATRSYVYRAAKGIKPLIGFGSTNDLREPGNVIFVSSPFAHLDEDCERTPPKVIGEVCPRPFEAKHLFNLSGMSFGALSEPAIKALSKGAAEAGIWMNTGEGALSAHHLYGGGDVIFQIGTAKYGVRDAAGQLSDEKLKEIAEKVVAFEIKLGQGAKPGKGGMLPGHKVTQEISDIRGIPVGVDSISPNRHLDVGNTDELLDMIQRIHEVTGRPVGIKIVVGSMGFIRELCQKILERGEGSEPDFITVDGAEGGTGAAPQVLADHMGLPLREGLPMVVDTLIEYGLRQRIDVISSGKLVTASAVAEALCLGSDFCVSARGFLFSLGCIQSLQCHTDTCPTGITTQDKRLQRGLDIESKAQRVAQYAKWMNSEVDMIAHSCGLRSAHDFRREHARIVTTANKSMPMEVMFPHPGGDLK